MGSQIFKWLKGNKTLLYLVMFWEYFFVEFNYATVIFLQEYLTFKQIWFHLSILKIKSPIDFIWYWPYLPTDHCRWVSLIICFLHISHDINLGTGGGQYPAKNLPLPAGASMPTHLSGQQGKNLRFKVHMWSNDYNLSSLIPIRIFYYVLNLTLTNISLF